MNAQDKKLFKEFLKLNKGYKRFKKMYNRYAPRKSNLRDYLNRVPAPTILAYAFYWSKDTNNGVIYWSILDDKWNTYLNKSYEQYRETFI